MKLKLNWDGVGIIASLACAIHCAILPLVLTSLPLFGMNIIHNDYFEWTMIILTIGIGTYALYHGYITHHRNLTPVMIFLTGTVFLIIKQFTPNHSQLFLALAVTLIVIAHYKNYRLCSRNKCSSVHHKH